MSTRLVATLLCLLSLATVRAQTLGQSISPSSSPACADQFHQTADAHQAGHAISARLLAIPSSAWQHYGRAVAAAARNQPALADQEAAQALAIAPRFAEVYLLRALQAARSGQPELAVPLFASAHTLAPDLPWVRVAAAGALNQLHRFDQAVTELESVAGPETASWQARYERARAEAGLGNLPVALHWSQLAIAAAPVGCTDARLLQANLLNRAGRPGDVIAELETYLAEDRVQTRRSQIEAILEHLRSSVQTASPHGAQPAASSELGNGLLAMN